MTQATILDRRTGTDRRQTAVEFDAAENQRKRDDRRQRQSALRVIVEGVQLVRGEFEVHRNSEREALEDARQAFAQQFPGVRIDAVYQADRIEGEEE